VIQLDTSFLIRALVRHSREDTLLREWLRGGEAVMVDALAWTEFLCGPVSPAAIAAARELVGEASPFGAREAERAARLFNESGRRRGTLVDCMISASAIENQASLATSNPADFRRFVPFGLRLAA
jgi:predicted nucleic acid-binding protein